MPHRELLVELAKNHCIEARTTLLKNLVREFIEPDENNSSIVEIESFSFIVMKIFDELPHFEQIWVASRLCRTKQITPELLERLLKIKHEIRETLVEFSPMLSPDQQKKLASSRDKKIQIALARRPNLPSSVTKKLAEIGCPILVCTILANTKTEISKNTAHRILIMANVEKLVLSAIAERAIKDNKFRSIIRRLINSQSALFPSKLKSALLNNKLASLIGAAKDLAHSPSFLFRGRRLTFYEAHTLCSDNDLCFDTLLLDLLKQKELTAVIWLISRRTSLPECTVENVLRSPAESAVANLMNATGISPKTFKEFLKERGDWLHRRPKFYFNELQKFRSMGHMAEAV